MKRERKREGDSLAHVLMHRQASSYKRVGINFLGSRSDFIKLTEVPFRLYHESAINSSSDRSYPSLFKPNYGCGLFPHPFSPPNPSFYAFSLWYLRCS